MSATVGTCSLCGGRVTVPAVWMSVIPPVPTCEHCGAVGAEHGPVIPMRPAAPVRTWPSTRILEFAGQRVELGYDPERLSRATLLSPFTVDSTGEVRP